ncbi:hypothetical protein V496_01738 [Pseudogymnoascus sp. VKM F-4515 (FW-2607)]|nr:hypothetical protein V496_01738 [Pseudogymnoascus sp. VKM F-4515 (FW-2607)]KFY92851.1 hypothetical protein V498_04728 [Pseudogymnoascus sp. VKM F-4517 (FW-2822)]
MGYVLQPREKSVLTVIIAIVVLGAVGRGIGRPSESGSLAVSSPSETLLSESKSTPSENSSSESKSTPSKTSPLESKFTPSPTSTTPSRTFTEISGPSAILISDCPSSNNTFYSADLGDFNDLLGLFSGDVDPTMSFRKLCGFSYPNGLGSFLVDVAARSLDDCINLCAEYIMKNLANIDTGTADACNAVCWRNTSDKNEVPG